MVLTEHSTLVLASLRRLFFKRTSLNVRDRAQAQLLWVQFICIGMVHFTHTCTNDSLHTSLICLTWYHNIWYALKCEQLSNWFRWRKSFSESNKVELSKLRTYIMYQTLKWKCGQASDSSYQIILRQFPEIIICNCNTY